MRKLLLLALFVSMLLACGGTSKADPTATPQENAWYACTLFIQQQLGLSMGDAQRYNPSGVTTLEAEHYKIEVYYAKQGNTYRCELIHHSNGDMELVSLEAK